MGINKLARNYHLTAFVPERTCQGPELRPGCQKSENMPCDMMEAEIPKLKGSKNPWLSGLQQYFQYYLSISIHLKGENPDSNRYKQ